jgi:hypothetical protein
MGPKRSEPRANHSPNVAAAQDPRRQGDHPSVTKRFSDSFVFHNIKMNGRRILTFHTANSYDTSRKYHLARMSS